MQIKGKHVGHWVWFPFRVVWAFIRRSGKRVAVTVAGVAVVLLGVIMLVTPGPGIPAIIAGLAILATEYVWAERALAKAKEKAVQAKDAVLRRNNRSGGGDAEPAEGPPE